MKTRSGAAGVALALLFVAGVTSMSEAKTFVYTFRIRKTGISMPS